MKQSFYIAALETRSSSDKKLELSVCIFFRQLNLTAQYFWIAPCRIRGSSNNESSFRAFSSLWEVHSTCGTKRASSEVLPAHRAVPSLPAQLPHQRRFALIPLGAYGRPCAEQPNAPSFPQNVDPIKASSLQGDRERLSRLLSFRCLPTP